MINFLISVVMWFYTVRVIAYSVYTFKDKNAAGGVSLIILAMLTFASSIVMLIDIFK